MYPVTWRSTGAASGIGLAAAKRLAGMGMRVCLLDKAPNVIDLARQLGEGCEGFIMDMSNPWT
ncbi:SDR family NAD(P)-dependent oxidoreductase [Salinicola peritrichatus]|uniref:SDR family NAD(P)-dependent oxidoreductase n=1 Tax=Salinicola peritrichatus TaxID=1267424 RepID=UPI000DA10B99